MLVLDSVIHHLNHNRRQGGVSRTSRSRHNIAAVANIFAIDALNRLGSPYYPKGTSADQLDQPVKVARLCLDDIFSWEFMHGIIAIVGLVLVVEVFLELELVMQIL